MLRRWFALVLAATVAFVGAGFAVSAASSHPPVRPVHQRGPLVVVSMPALSWADVSPTRTPTLWTLALHGAVAAQTTKVLSSRSCANVSWLTLSAGTPTSFGRAEDNTGSEPSQPPKEPPHCSKPLVPHRHADGTAAFPKWDTWHQTARTRGAPVSIGRVATSLAAAGQCIAAAGGSAALGAADEQGVVAHYTPSVDHVDLGTCPVTFIGLTGPDDAYLGRLLRRLPADATIVVSGMADESGPTTLHALVVAGPGVPHGVLTSLSTRQPGFVQTADLSALVVDRLGSAAPTLSAGRPPVVRPESSPTAPIREVSGLARALQVEYSFVPLFFGLFLGGAGLAVLAGLLWWWRRGVVTPRLRQWFAAVGAMSAATPVATFLAGLVPWWGSAHPRLALALTVLGTAAALGAIALFGPWRRWVGGPATFLIAVTLVVVAEDVVHGSRLQFISMMGLQPVYGGRYYGQGNVGYAVFATTALLLAALLAGRLIDAGHPRTAAVTVGLIGMAAVVIDGSPLWGADGGGPLAMIPAVAYLALNAAGLSLTWKRIAVIAGASVVVVGGFAVLDYLRPPRYRTHLGDFVASLRHTGKLGGLGRIFSENWTMLTANWLNMSVALLLLATMLVLLVPRVLGRPLQPLLDRVTLLGHGLAAVAVCWLLGFLANDSGTSIPPTGLLVVVPLLILLAACTHRPSAAERIARMQLGHDQNVTRLPVHRVS